MYSVPIKPLVQAMNRPLKFASPPSWQQQLAQAVTDPEQVHRLVGCHADALPHLADTPFKMLAPHSYLARIRPHDPHDPLLRQIWPSPQEAQVVEGFSDDPTGDQQALAAPGILHKYAGRVLLMVTQACAIHCRFCFRRAFPYRSAVLTPHRWRQALHYLATHPDIREVILSGGDPLVLSNTRLTTLIDDLAGITSIKRLRIHTRVPVVLPDRIEPGLLITLQRWPRPLVIVIHTNHPQELTTEVQVALQHLRSIGVTLLNQNVLLHGINDNINTLIALYEGLFSSSVLPYYLHQLDRVTGAAHFAVAPERAYWLMAELRRQLPGYLVPRFVQEQPGHASKTVLR